MRKILLFLIVITTSIVFTMRLFYLQVYASEPYSIYEDNAIRNYTQFIVPERKILSELVLEKYKGEDKIAFYGVYKTNKLWEPTEDIVPLLSAWGHIDSEKLIGKNILSYSDNLELSIDQRENYGYVELGAGMYIILVQNGNTINAEYELSFILK